MSRKGGTGGCGTGGGEWGHPQGDMHMVAALLAKAGSGLRFSFGVRAWTEKEIRCVKGMFRLKLVSSENNYSVKITSLRLLWIQ